MHAKREAASPGGSSTEHLHWGNIFSASIFLSRFSYKIRVKCFSISGFPILFPCYLVLKRKKERKGNNRSFDPSLVIPSKIMIFPQEEAPFGLLAVSRRVAL